MKKKQSQPFRSILIYGMGMMGTSLALTLKKVSPHVRIGAVLRSRKNIKYIESLNVINQIAVCSSPKNNDKIPYNSYELIVFAIPVVQFLNAVPELPYTASLITDMSSSQKAIQEAFALRDDLRFVSSHPLCGSEKEGPQAAMLGLFKDKLCLVSHLSRSSKHDIEIIQAFWRSLGMHVHLTSSQVHDNALAYLSHCPHLISSLLATWAASKRDVNSLRNHSPIVPTSAGFHDMIRVAGSNPKMWVDIIQTNYGNIVSGLEEFKYELDLFIDKLKNQKPSLWARWIDKAAKMRNKLYTNDSGKT